MQLISALLPYWPDINTSTNGGLLENYHHRGCMHQRVHLSLISNFHILKPWRNISIKAQKSQKNFFFTVSFIIPAIDQQTVVICESDAFVRVGFCAIVIKWQWQMEFAQHLNLVAHWFFKFLLAFDLTTP